MGFLATTPTPTPPGPPWPRLLFSKPPPQCPNTSTTPLFFPIPPQLSSCSRAKPQPHVHPFFPFPPHSSSLLRPRNPKPRPHFISLPVPEPWPLPSRPHSFPSLLLQAPLQFRPHPQTTPPPPSRPQPHPSLAGHVPLNPHLGTCVQPNLELRTWEGPKVKVPERLPSDTRVPHRPGLEQSNPGAGDPWLGERCVSAPRHLRLGFTSPPLPTAPRCTLVAPTQVTLESLTGWECPLEDC